MVSTMPYDKVKDTMHFLITGHTGFKGAWLSLLLLERGHKVSGVSLKPDDASLFVKAGVSKLLLNDIMCDIRDYSKMEEHFKVLNPDIVIHFAAQSLVQDSYSDPMNTFGTNVSGTLNVLKASQAITDLQAQLIVTTDKVYRNVNQLIGYVEIDPLGGQDPYSASKAMADIATQSWLASFKNAPTAIARAGNVIGGGDICASRLIPELVASYSSGLIPKLRAPNSVRPWQHVLDCLNGYLILIDSLLKGGGNGAWNFGPDKAQIKTVADVANIAGEIWGVSENWEQDFKVTPYEAHLLMLNSDKARNEIGWRDKLSFEESISWAITWYKNVHYGNDVLDETLRNIRDFESK
jgi:CDP-glucose 4,6-dehydratase